MRTSALPALLAVGVLAAVAAACGDDTTDPAASPTTLPAVPPTDAPPPTGAPPATDGGSDAAGYDYPTGADDVVFEYAELGGFTTPEYYFQSTPSILVSGDGRLFTPGPQIAIYPGPLLPNIQVRSITDEGIQQLLAAADRAGLLAEVDYRADLNIADATVATVTIEADGDTWVHEAYALGLAFPDGSGDEVSPERQSLADFLAALLGGDVVDESELGEEEAFLPDEYLIRALAVDDPAAFGGDGVEPTIVDWPLVTGVSLADAASCVAVSAADAGDVLASATQLTFFVDDGVTYQVFAKPALPGAACDD